MKLKNYISEKKKTRLIFDVDYTIFKYDLPWERWHEKIEKVLRNWDEIILKRYLANKINLNTLENFYIEKIGLDAKKFLTKNTIWFETKLLKQIIPNNELINFIKNNTYYKLFIWSSNSASLLKKSLREYKISNKFEKIISCEDVYFLKPRSDGFKLISEPQTIKSEYLFIGDSESDKDAAGNLNIDYYYVDYFKNVT